MPLHIEITKRADSRSVLRCTREDGTQTWQKKLGAQSAFFPFHDIVHYSVESVLDLRQGFYGLVASGWDIEDTDGKGKRGAIPKATILAEHIVNLFANELTSGTRWEITELDEQLAIIAAKDDLPPPPRFTDVIAERVRSRIAELLARYSSLEAGERLELEF